jgi:hypothetical protein
MVSSLFISTLPHKIFCNFGRSEGIFLELLKWSCGAQTPSKFRVCKYATINWKLKLGVLLCWKLFFWYQDWQLKWWHSMIMRQSNLVVVCSHSVVWIWQSTWIWMQILSAYVHFHCHHQKGIALHVWVGWRLHFCYGFQCCSCQTGMSVWVGQRLHLCKAF